MKILIIQPAFIGDVVLATAFAESLHKLYPDAQLDFFLRKGTESLLENHPYIHQRIVWDKKNNKFGHLIHLIRKIRRERYDRVYNLHRHFNTGLLTSLSKAGWKVGFRENPFSSFYEQSFSYKKSKATHEIERNFSLLGHEKEAILEPPRLYPAEIHIQRVEKLNTGRYYITVHPSSAWFTKQLPKEKWIRLIQKQSTKTTIYLLGAPNDFDLGEEIKNICAKQNVINLCGKLGFLESCVLMQKAEMNYVNDSAPLHFCSAINAPVTVFFCSTDPAYGFGPLGKRAHIIKSPLHLKCHPCGEHGRKKCPENHFKCATTIEI